MTPEDRELLQTLRRQQLDLQRSLARLDVQLADLEARASTAPVEETPPAFPPIPPHLEPPPVLEAHLPPLFPPLPLATESTQLPPLPAPPTHPLPPAPSLEFQLGKWLTRIGAVFFILFLVSADSYFQLHKLLGAWGKLGLGAAASMVFILVGQRLERTLVYWGRSVIAAGLGGLYVTLYAACNHESLRVIHNPLLGGLLLLWWSAYVLFFADRKKSQALALFAILLAYFSTAINPVGRFTMGADLILAATAVLFMVRNGWSALSYLSLVGTYAALVRRLLIDENGELVFDTSRSLSYWPHAVYLIGAWLIFTAAVILTSAPTFRGGKRFAFLSLNNGALAGLLVLTAYIAGYGHGPMGWSLLATGFAFLFTSRIVGWAQIEPEAVMAAYAAQGLTLVTAGVIVVYTGITRGALLVLETFFLGMAGAFSGDFVLIASTAVAAFFGTIFLIWEIAINAHHPWLLGFGGAIIMLVNAWWSRLDLRHGPKARTTIVLASSYYCAMALGLIFTGMYTELSDETLPPALAFAALVLTFLIYFVSIYELPAMAQVLLLVAQGLVLFPFETGEDLPWWSSAGVAAVTLLMLTWWARQRVTRTGDWTKVLNCAYSLALAYLAYQTLRPWVDAQGWMITASFLSVAFLLWGAFNRVWAIAAVGQLFLAAALYHFFIPPGTSDVFPWTWWAAAVPIVIVFSTGRAAHTWLDLFPGSSTDRTSLLRALAYGYQALALVMLIRWIVALVPPLDQVATLLLLGTLLLYWNIRPFNAFGVRCSYLLSLTGLWLYVSAPAHHAIAMATFLNSLAFFSFLSQPALFRLSNRTVSQLESWTLIFLAVGANWLFLSEWIQVRTSLSYLSMAWALYALFLYLFGRMTPENRITWCGYGILTVAIGRVFCVDFWGLSNGYKVLTFIVLTFITLGLGYLILRSSERAKPTA